MTVRDPSAWPYCQVITVSRHAVVRGGLHPSARFAADPASRYRGLEEYSAEQR